MKKEASAKKNRGIRYIWILITTILLVGIASMAFDRILFSNQTYASATANVFLMTLFAGSVTAAGPLLFIRLVTCFIRKDRGVLIKNRISLIVGDIAIFVILPTYAYVFYQTMAKRCVEEGDCTMGYTVAGEGFLHLFSGQNDWIIYLSIALAAALIVVCILMNVLHIVKTKPVRLVIKEEKRIAKEKKDAIQEERRAEAERQATILKAKKDEERRVQEEKALEEKKAEEEAKRLEKEKREKEAEEKALAKQEAEQKSLSQKQEKQKAMAAERKPSDKLTVTKKEEIPSKNATEPITVPPKKKELTPEETRKTVYRFFSFYFILLMIYEFLFLPYFSDEPEFGLLTLMLGAIGLIVNIVFMIMAYMNPKKIRLAFKELAINFAVSQFISLLLSFVFSPRHYDYYDYYGGRIDSTPLLFVFPSLLLIAEIVLLILFRKKTKETNLINIGMLALPILFNFVVATSCLCEAPCLFFFLYNNPNEAKIVSIVCIVFGVIALLFFGLGAKGLYQSLELSITCPQKVRLSDEEKLAALKTELEEANKNGDVEKASRINKKIAELSQTAKPISFEGESKFDGGLLQLIGWKILGALVTGITFGIGYPWSVCFVERWVTKHTTINGRRLKFNGKGIQLFGKYIIWFLLTLITFGIYSFWLVIKMKKWVISHTNFADASPEEESVKSKFDGRLLQLIGYNILGFLITIFTLGIGYPWAECLVVNWESKHTVINGKREAFDGKGIQLFGKYIIWLLLTLITFGIYAFWLSIKMRKWVTSHTHFYEEK